MVALLCMMTFIVQDSAFNPTAFVTREDLSDVSAYVKRVYNNYAEDKQRVISIHKSNARKQLMPKIVWQDYSYIAYAKDHPGLVKLSDLIDDFLYIYKGFHDGKLLRDMKYSKMERDLLARGMPKSDLQKLNALIMRHPDNGRWLQTEIPKRLVQMAEDQDSVERMMKFFKTGVLPEARDLRQWLALNQKYKLEVEQSLCEQVLSEFSKRGRVVFLSYALESRYESLFSIELYSEPSIEEQVQKLVSIKNMNKGEEK